MSKRVFGGPNGPNRRSPTIWADENRPFSVEIPSLVQDVEHLKTKTAKMSAEIRSLDAALQQERRSRILEQAKLRRWQEIVSFKINSLKNFLESNPFEDVVDTDVDAGAEELDPLFIQDLIDGSVPPEPQLFGRAVGVVNTAAANRQGTGEASRRRKRGERAPCPYCHKDLSKTYVRVHVRAYCKFVPGYT